MDQRTCRVCKALNGYTWTFVVGKDQFPNMLTFNGQNVWDVHQGSRAHGHQDFNCRCHITPEIDLQSILEKVQTWKKDLEEQLEATA